MNYGISILFRAIPLAMAAFCFAYGAYVFAAGDDPSRLTAGPVLFFLGSICIALYCTAATSSARSSAPIPPPRNTFSRPSAMRSPP